MSLFAILLELWQDVVGNAFPVKNLEKHRLKVVVWLDVDLNAAENHDLAVIGTSLRYLEDIVTNVLVQHVCCLCSWVS